MIIAIILLAILCTVAIFLLNKKNAEAKQTASEFNAFRERYKPITDVDEALASAKKQLADLSGQMEASKVEATKNENDLRRQYAEKRVIYDSLSKEVSVLEERLEDISYGLYQPHYSYDTSDEYRLELDKIFEQEKQLIKDGKATFCPIEWTVEGSKQKGAKMTKDNSKLMLRAFNGECDAAVARVSWNNAVNMEARIQKALEAINKLGETNKISVTEPYFNLKMSELHLEYERQEKLHQEKEEQKRIREQMREEEKVQQEIEKAKKQAEDEETRSSRALAKARDEVAHATGKQLDDLNAKIQELEGNLKEAQEMKERAMSRAQMTKSGHVYVVSNIGAFGDNVYKIGMTRRLEPMDRIDELSNASVPFNFDIHGMIYTDNAPELEHKFHVRFDELRLNLLNQRREFFNVSIEDIENVAKELGLELELTKLAEAKEYRATQSLREAKKQPKTEETPEAKNSFPADLI
jgi:hypothetical protein